MTKSESFNWHRTSKICNGIYDFGLLRDKPDVEEEEEKPKLFSIYFSRTVFIVGIIAGVTFMVCLVLADRYQKSAHTPHHYASFIYEKEGDKRYLHKHHRYNLTLDASENADLNSYRLRKLQNLSKYVPIDEINQLMPITTVLHSVNVTERSSRAFPGRLYKSPNLDELNKNVSGIRLVDSASRGPLSLAELLKRTEVHARTGDSIIENDDNERTPTTTATPQTSTLQFAQLESYKHYYNTKNVQDILKYVNCPTAEECNPNVDNITDPTKAPAQHVEQFDGVIEDVEPAGHDRAQAETDSFVLNRENDIAAGGLPESDLLYADSTIPIYFSPFLPPDPHNPAFDQFYDFRASSPLEINEMDQTAGVGAIVAEPQATHRFSNRIYSNQQEPQDNARLLTEDLEQYLKPPTPPPTGISFTPSYTASMQNDLNEAAGDFKPANAVESATGFGVETRPISLMVEIFPATDYQLPVLRHGEQHEPPYLNREGNVNNVADLSLNPAWLPWRLSPAYNQNNQNRMRLFVNLFPQLSPKINANEVP